MHLPLYVSSYYIHAMSNNSGVRGKKRYINGQKFHRWFCNAVTFQSYHIGQKSPKITSE